MSPSRDAGGLEESVDGTADTHEDTPEIGVGSDLEDPSGDVAGTPDEGPSNAPAHDPELPHPLLHVPPPPDPVEGPVPADWLRFRLRLDYVTGDFVTKNNHPWDVVATDMDLDGDPDVFVNWHHLERTELYENTGVGLVLLNPRSGDPTGLFESRDVPEVYAQPDELPGGISPDVPGVYVWHDYDRRFGMWNVYTVPNPDPSEGYGLTIDGNTWIERIEGLSDELYQQDDAYRISLAPNVLEGGPHHIRIKLVAIAHSLALVAQTEHGVEPPTFYAGLTRQPLEGGRLTLTKPDPHGVAWVDAWGSPEPEIYMSRGAAGGLISPPRPPKIDRFYLYVGEPGSPRYELAEEGTIPGDYGRGRQVAWVDIDNDGVNELYVSNQESPNVFLQSDGPDRWVDRAPALGLDFHDATTFTWMDVNGDRLEDLIFLDAGAFRVAINRGESGFEVRAGTTLGLLAPAMDLTLSLNRIGLQVFDLDNDGRLDLWLSGYALADDAEGPPRQTVYRKTAGGFEEATTELGLADSTGGIEMRPADYDNDGFVDVLTLDPNLSIYRNVGGHRFEALPVAVRGEGVTCCRGAVVDLDQDGRLDLVVIRPEHRAVFFNETISANRSLAVHLSHDPRPPIGALVRAHYSDGTVRVQRYGSASNSRYSQSLLPLHFGAAQGRTIDRVGVQWPGEPDEVVVDVAPEERELTFERPDD